MHSHKDEKQWHDEHYAANDILGSGSAFHVLQVMAVMQTERHCDWLKHVHESDGNTCCFGTALKENKSSNNRWGRNVCGTATGIVA